MSTDTRINTAGGPGPYPDESFSFLCCLVWVFARRSRPARNAADAFRAGKAPSTSFRSRTAFFGASACHPCGPCGLTRYPNLRHLAASVGAAV